MYTVKEPKRVNLHWPSATQNVNRHFVFPEPEWLGPPHTRPARRPGHSRRDAPSDRMKSAAYAKDAVDDYDGDYFGDVPRRATEDIDADRVPEAAPPDQMFHTKRTTSLREVTNAWLSHMKYILPFSIGVIMVLYTLMYYAHAKCTATLTREAFELGGQTEITRRWMRCFTPNFSDDEFRPLNSIGDFSVYVIRYTKMWSVFSADNNFFVHMFAWNLLARNRTWKTRLYFVWFALFYVSPLIDYQVTGFRHMASWYVQMGCQVCGWITCLAASETRDMPTMSWWFVYHGMAGITYIFALRNLAIGDDDSYSLQLKLLVRFVFDPMMWEAMKTAQRHVAMMNPSPGPGLNTCSIMAPIISQAVYSRLLLFLLTNDGKVSVITLQLIISLNELMMKLTLKHRDGFFTRTVMGTMAGDALLSSAKMDELHAVSCLADVFCELGAIAFITPLMVVFNLPSTGDLPDGKTRTSNYDDMAWICFQLAAMEIGMSFVNTFAQYRFHSIDIGRVFKQSEAAYRRQVKLSRPDGAKGRNYLSYKFLVYTVMAVFFATCALNTVMGTMWTLRMCPRVRSDGHVYFRACLPTEEKHLPGGSSVKGPGILAYNFDWPPWKSQYAIDTSNQNITYEDLRAEL